MKKVLVLDDDHDIATVVTMLLDDSGYKSRCITNHKKLEETLLSYEPEVLILDISLGGVDGRDLCKKIKEGDYGDHIRVILFSANRDASKHYKDYKADAFIPKPFDTKQLIKTVEALSA